MMNPSRCADAPWSEIEALDQGIWGAQRHVAERFEVMLSAVRRGDNIRELETELRSLRNDLEGMLRQRRQLLRARAERSAHPDAPMVLTRSYARLISE
jgi:hypothetical protein